MDEKVYLKCTGNVVICSGEKMMYYENDDTYCIKDCFIMPKKHITDAEMQRFVKRCHREKLEEKGGE